MARQLLFISSAHDNALHAVRHNGEQAVGDFFWQAGAVVGVSVDKPCVVFGKITKFELILVLSLPDGNNYPVNLI